MATLPHQEESWESIVESIERLKAILKICIDTFQSLPVVVCIARSDGDGYTDQSMVRSSLILSHSESGRQDSRSCFWHVTWTPRNSGSNFSSFRNPWYPNWLLWEMPQIILELRLLLLLTLFSHDSLLSWSNRWNVCKEKKTPGVVWVFVWVGCG